ncbi:MAG: helix-turn-helix transcriptional regulator [Betaproteobacteria bacterium]
MQVNAHLPAKRALRKPAVLERTGLSNSSLYRLIQQGKFPAPYKLSERLSAWNEAEIDDWLAAKFERGAAQ